MDTSRKVERYRAGQKPSHCALEYADDSGRFNELLGRINDSRLTRLDIVETVPSSSSPSLEIKNARKIFGANRRRHTATVIEDVSYDEATDLGQIRRQKFDNEILEDSHERHFTVQNHLNTADSVAARRARIRRKTASSIGLSPSRRYSGDSASHCAAKEMIFPQNMPGTSNLETDSDSYSSTFSEDEMVLKPAFVPRQKRISAQKKHDEYTTHTTIGQQHLKRKYIKETLAASIEHEIDRSMNFWQSASTDDKDNIRCDEDFTKWKIRELRRLKSNTESKNSNSMESTERTMIRVLSDDTLKGDELHENVQKQKKSRKFMQKYYHKGAFYMDDTSLSKDENDVRKKSYDGETGEDRFNFGILPKVLQVKNFGKRGRTKYTHLMDQDTTQTNGYMQKFSAYHTFNERPRNGTDSL